MNIGKLKTELLEIHKSFIQAHLGKNVDFMVKDLAPDYFSISNGETRHPAKEDIRTRFTAYLNSTTFSAYKDLAPPVIKISHDGTMAWMVINMNIAGKRTSTDGTEHVFDHIWAWVEVYFRQEGRWIRQGEASCARDKDKRIE